MKFLAVTACPLGIVHTYMAAENIRLACEREGVECKVETQGLLGIDNEITLSDIESADAVILTTDMPIKKSERFNDLKQIMTDVRTLVKQADVVVANLMTSFENE